MPTAAATGDTLSHLDDASRALVRLSARLAGGLEDEVRVEMQRAADVVPHAWVEELLLQTYLFAGFPRALNGMREWRRLTLAPAATAAETQAVSVRQRGEETCARVYGTMYAKLRQNIRALHPLLDDWMIEEGYGKVLGRKALDLPRRELCIVAACAATAQDRQLQSHLHGALNVGVPEQVVTIALESLQGVIPAALHARAARLWDRVRGRPK